MDHMIMQVYTYTPRNSCPDFSKLIYQQNVPTPGCCDLILMF